MKKDIKITNHGELETITYTLGDTTYFEFNSINDKYIKTIKSLFYEKNGDRYLKKYPSTLKNIDSLIKNFHKYAFEMIEQFGYFKPAPIEKSLLELIRRLERHSIDYSIIGGTSLLVRGIPVKTHDIDIMLDPKDLDKINLVFDDCIIEPIQDTDGWVIKYFGVAFLRARIDLSFEPQEFADQPEPTDFGPYAMNNLEEVTWKGFKLKVPPIKLYLDVCIKRGKINRVNLIKEYMRKG